VTAKVRLGAADWAWMLALSGAGVVLLLVSVVLQPPASLAILPNILGQLGALLIATGVLGVGFDLFGKREISEGVVQDFALANAAKSVRLDSVSFTRGTETLARHPELAASLIENTGSGEIRFLVAGRSHIETDLRAQLTEATHSGAHVTAFVPRGISDADHVKRSLRHEIRPGDLDIVDVDSDGSVFAFLSPSHAVLAHSSTPAGGGPFFVLVGSPGREGDTTVYTHVSDLLGKLEESSAPADGTVGTSIPTRGTRPSTTPLSGTIPAGGGKLAAEEIELMSGRGRHALDVRPLEPLVRSGWIKEGSKLTWSYKKRPYEATVLADGTLVLDGKLYSTPSAAANDIIDSGAVSGWEAWKLDGLPLRVVRERAIAASSE